MKLLQICQVRLQTKKFFVESEWEMNVDNVVVIDSKGAHNSEEEKLLIEAFIFVENATASEPDKI